MVGERRPSAEWLVAVESRQALIAETRMPHNIRMHLTGYSGVHPLPHAGELNRNATELRTAFAFLWRCDLGAEPPLVAETYRLISMHSIETKGADTS